MKNEKSRFTITFVVKGCPCKIHASLAFDGLTYKIKTLWDEHTLKMDKG